MSKTKAKAMKSKVLGHVEESVGKITDNPKLEVKGKIRQGLGKAYELSDDYQNEVKDAKDMVVGTVKEKTGQLIHDTSLEVRGKVQKVKAGNKFPRKVLYSLGILAFMIFLVRWVSREK